MSTQVTSTPISEAGSVTRPTVACSYNCYIHYCLITMGISGIDIPWKTYLYNRK